METNPIKFKLTLLLCCHMALSTVLVISCNQEHRCYSNIKIIINSKLSNTNSTVFFFFIFLFALH